MATIKEIAALAGVSRGTVDRVLNHRGCVSPATAEKIERLARDLDYRPNRAGLVLAAQRIILRWESSCFPETIPSILMCWQAYRKKPKSCPATTVPS